MRKAGELPEPSDDYYRDFDALCLAVDAGDRDALLALADLFEERGDSGRAAPLRWAHRHGKRPRQSQGGWSWYYLQQGSSRAGSNQPFDVVVPGYGEGWSGWQSPSAAYLGLSNDLANVGPEEERREGRMSGPGGEAKALHVLPFYSRHGCRFADVTGPPGYLNRPGDRSTGPVSSEEWNSVEQHGHAHYSIGPTQQGTYRASYHVHAPGNYFDTDDTGLGEYPTEAAAEEACERHHLVLHAREDVGLADDAPEGVVDDAWLDRATTHPDLAGDAPDYFAERARRGVHHSLGAGQVRKGFMERQVEHGLWYEVDHDHTDFVPYGLVGDLGVPVGGTVDADTEGWDRPTPEDLAEYGPDAPTRWQNLCDALLPYTECHDAGHVGQVTLRSGYGARMSAPGYSDATEWTVYATQEEAERELSEMYGDEEEEAAEEDANLLERVNLELEEGGAGFQADPDDPVSLLAAADWLEEYGDAAELCDGLREMVDRLSGEA